MYEDATAFFQFVINLGLHETFSPSTWFAKLWVHLQDQIGEVDRLKRKWWHPRDGARVTNRNGWRFMYEESMIFLYNVRI